MKSFENPDTAFDGMPADIGVLLGRVDVSKGREELYEDQLPELLRALADQTRVESIRASNAIEGVEVPEGRAERLAGDEKARLRNRSEKEFAGYRDAIDGMMRADHLEPPTVPDMLYLHRQLFKYTKARGGYLKTEDNLIATREQGVRTIDFKPPPWQMTESMLLTLFAGYQESLERERAHPLVLLSAFIVDFQAIHPVLDGNGRTARLLTTHELLRLGYRVARYASVEQRIYESKNRYYAALRESQVGWHDAKHEIWPWTRYLVGVVFDCYGGFEERVAAGRSANGMSKQERVQDWVQTFAGSEFRLREIRNALPGISDQTIRLALKPLKAEGVIKPEGSGPGARWLKLGGRQTQRRPRSA